MIDSEAEKTPSAFGGGVKKIFPSESEESRGGGLKTHKTENLVGELLKSLTSVQEIALEVEVL